MVFTKEEECYRLRLIYMNELIQISYKKSFSQEGPARHTDFEVSLGNSGRTIYFSVAGKKMLWNGLTGDLDGVLEPSVTRKLDEIVGLAREREHELHSGAALDLRASLVSALGDGFVSRWLDSPAPANLETLPSLALEPRYFIVFTASACNMACSYCSNAGGTYGSAENKGLLSRANAEKFVEFVSSRRAHSSRPIQVTIIGGEPTLNPDVCTYLCKALLSLNDSSGPSVQVKLTTNGLVVPEAILDLFARYPEHSFFGFSLDGARDRNDRYRVDHRARGTFDRVFKTVQSAKERGIAHQVTAVVGYPFEFVETFEELRFLGVEAVEIKSRSETEHGFNRDDPRRAFAHVQKWREQYIRYNQHILSELAMGDLGIRTERPVTLRQIMKATAGDPLACDAGTELLALSSNGTFYPCDRFFPDDESALGHVANGFDPNKVDALKQRMSEHADIINQQSTCVSCFARSTCRGGCYAENMHKHGSIDSIIHAQCNLRREKLKVDLYFIARLREEFPNRFEKVMTRG